MVEIVLNQLTQQLYLYIITFVSSRVLRNLITMSLGLNLSVLVSYWIFSLTLKSFVC